MYDLYIIIIDTARITLALHRENFSIVPGNIDAPQA